MELTQEQITEYCNETKNFVKSDAFQNLIKPTLSMKIANQLPDPTTEGWESRYKMLMSKATAINELVSVLEGLSNQAQLAEFQRLREEEHGAVE